MRTELINTHVNETRIGYTSRPRLRRKDVPEYLRDVHGLDISIATLNTMATRGGGPIMQYSGRIPLYHRNDLDEWANKRLSKPVHSTSEL